MYFTCYWLTVNLYIQVPSCIFLVVKLQSIYKDLFNQVAVSRVV